ncbi:MAG: ABC transporter ATP-binding protein [Nitrososphaeria archaeon]|jgi:ATP-binding cassette subfamily B protein
MSEGHDTFSARVEQTKKRRIQDRVLITRLYQYMKPYKRNLIFGTVSIAGGALTGLASPYLHLLAINDIITPTILNHSSSYLSAFIWWIPIFVIVTLGTYFFQYVQTYQMRIVGENVVMNLRDQCTAKLQQISLRYFSEGEIGRIMSRPTTDSNQVRIFIRMGLTTMITDVAAILGSLVIIFFLSWQLALVAVSVLPIAVIMAWFLGGWSRKQYRQTLTNLAGLVGKLQENCSGIKVIKALVKEDDAAKGFDEVNKKTVDSYKRTVLISTVYQPLINTLRIIGTVLILGYGAVLAINGSINLGILAAFLEYQFSYFTPVTDFLTAYDQYQSCMSALERIYDLVDTKVEVMDLDKAIEIETINDVRFENVTFGYDINEPVIHDINLHLEGSEKLAIVGPTGAGKSTIINLLERFYDPIGGRVLVNGYDVKDIKIASLRRHMSTVLQDSFLFSMSVTDNIRFGKPEASDADVIQAAKTVGAHEFIMRLPRGYDYVIEESSSNISIGQRQLISFARTLLMDPKLLILDEATSSIDPYTELMLQNALKKLLENRMAIIIAHRLSTIRLCDEILVIDQGKIVEKGSHAELMKLNGLYSSFYRMQFKEEQGVEIAAAEPNQEKVK